MLALLAAAEATAPAGGADDRDEAALQAELDRLSKTTVEAEDIAAAAEAAAAACGNTEHFLDNERTYWF